MAYAIDYYDLKSAYGIVITNGRDALLQPPTVKDPYTHNWEDQNGIEVDTRLGQLYNDRNITLNGWMFATSLSDFYTKYEAFLSRMMASGLRALYSAELDKTFLVRFTGMSVPGSSKLRANTGGVEMAVTINFQEPAFSYASGSRETPSYNPDFNTRAYCIST